MTTDYTQYPVAYQIKKALRYARLYGVSRTLEKVRGQYHVRQVGGALTEDWRNSRMHDDVKKSVAIIGAGNFAFSNIAYYCNKIRPGSIRCAYDPIGARAVSLVKRYGGLYAAADPLAAIADPRVRTVFVASNHASHADYAVEAIRRQKIVHIEKPHVVSRAQLSALIGACKDRANGSVFLGFNRPRSEHYRRLNQLLERQDGPMMINWFIAGHQLASDHWYFSEAEGGRVLGNLCHWTDLTLRAIGVERAFPVRVAGTRPLGSESDFAVSMVFAEGSVAVISFSAKGHMFEGVREYLNVHKGDLLASLRDFHVLTWNVGDKGGVYRSRGRDHGHRAAIEATLAGDDPESLEVVAQSANLFLGVREAVEAGRTVELDRVAL